MKKFMYIFALPLLLVAFAGCDKDEYPLGLPFTEYLSQSTERYWKEMPQNDDGYVPKGIIVVNSAEELEPYKNPNYSGEYPPIDFSRQTLLLAYGSAGSGIISMAIDRLELFPANQYRLNVEITLGITAVIRPWIITLLTDKITDESEIQLDVQYIEKPLAP